MTKEDAGVDQLAGVAAPPGINAWRMVVTVTMTLNVTLVSN